MMVACRSGMHADMRVAAVIVGVLLVQTDVASMEALAVQSHDVVVRGLLYVTKRYCQTANPPSHKVARTKIRRWPRKTHLHIHM